MLHLVYESSLCRREARQLDVLVARVLARRRVRGILDSIGRRLAQLNLNHRSTRCTRTLRGENCDTAERCSARRRIDQKGARHRVRTVVDVRHRVDEVPPAHKCGTKLLPCLHPQHVQT